MVGTQIYTHTYKIKTNKSLFFLKNGMKTLNGRVGMKLSGLHLLKELEEGKTGSLLPS